MKIIVYVDLGTAEAVIEENGIEYKEFLGEISSRYLDSYVSEKEKLGFEIKIVNLND